MLFDFLFNTSKSKKNCRKKTRYSSDYEAQQSIKRIRQKHGSGKYLRIYKCPECGGYHLTSKPPR